MEELVCPECGTALNSHQNCLEYLNEMIAWDFADFKGVGKIHHLTVLCYYLQHPSHYSQEALINAKQFLKEIVEGNLSLEDLYKKESVVFSSDKRNWVVEGRPENHGEYLKTVKWTMTSSDVVKDGVVEYLQHVKEWAQSIYSDLKNAKDL